MQLSAFLARVRTKAAELARDYGPPLRRHVWERETLQFVLHAALLLLLAMLVRPLFAGHIPDESLRSPTVFWEMIDHDIDLVRAAAKTQRSAMPRYLFTLVPTVLLLITRHKIRWENWEAGHALRWLVMAIVITLAWAGSTFDYNMYLNTGHLWDRLLLIALAVVSWRFPLAIPFFTVQAVIMLREVTLPLGHDDFDWRPITELLMLLSCFVWLSFLKTLRTRHYVFLALCWLGSYYYQAGISKLFAQPTGAWLTENHLSNLVVSSYIRGWLGFLPEHFVLSATLWMRKLDFAMALFTLAIAEIGAIVLLNAHPRLARWWLVSAALLHVGIFTFSGIFFWKWIVVDLAFWYFLARGGREVHRQIFKSKLIPLLGAFLIYASDGKTFFNPQIGVTWWDTNFNDVYHLYAVTDGGQKYPIDPGFFAPYDARMTQEDWCFVTKERRLTAVYGSTGSYLAFKELDAAKSPEDAERVLARRGGSCYHEGRARTFDEFVARYFANVNRFGRRHRWVPKLGRPDHIWIQRQTDDYALQAPVRRVEVWHERVLHDVEGRALHRLGSKKVHEIVVP